MPQVEQVSPQQASLPAGSEEPTLEAFFAGLAPDLRSQWAWDNYKPTIEALSRTFGLRRLIEIGGGRDPLFTPDEAAGLGIELTINDISEEELRHAPAAFSRARFDVAGDLGAAGLYAGQYDLAFSRMVFEHVADGRRAWGNLCEVLAPGGVAIAFVPTLYALPYVANIVIPEAVSQRIVKMLYKHRTDDEDPKFPAHYSWTYGSERKLVPMLRSVGFSEAVVVPFYYHDYFERIPVLRQIDNLANRVAAARDWRFLTSYAYIAARK
ncbi:class I SAM-dependent methyltransferase [Microbaculum marinum]|uniref:Methyltransferase domain-containing protein n=1 Tax=Microbaculum marinum TaxID=1764581 RepID=A0AAW9RXM2_9HYPH